MSSVEAGGSVDADALSVEPQELSPAVRNVAFAVIAGGLMLAALDSTIVATALPTIVGDLGGTEHVTWVVTAYMLTQTIATVLAGKFGDLYGRKTMFLLSIVVFTIASALCGLAQSMTWLIAMRALQGVGGGGLTVTAIAMIADIIPLRDRGRYQGSLGAVFGVTTVLGPLLGGFFTDNLSWRWVFYVNVPIAVVILALAVRLLPSTRGADRPVIDFLGIGFVSAGSATLILATSWGGTEYAWNSAVIIGLFVAAAVLLAIFVYVESRATDPLLPLRLFCSNVFSVCVVLAFIVGFALLGAITFLPTYLQYCQGVSATESGLRTLPLVAGLLVASTSSGNVVSRTGIYKPFPVVGSLVLGAGMFLLSRLDEFSGFWSTSLAMVVFGVGVGLTMQVLTIIVQGTAEYRDLGVATSGVTFFRTMGSAFGSAIFGTIYVATLTPKLAAAVLASGASEAQATNPATVAALPAAQRAPIVQAYAEAVQTVFLYAIPVALLAFVVALFLKQVPLRGLARPGATDVGKGFGIPDQRSSAEQLEGQVVRILRSRFAEAVPALIQESGTGLDAVQLWIVRQVAIQQARGGFADPLAIARGRHMPVGVIQPAIDAAIAGGLLAAGSEGLTLTRRGFEGFRDVVEAFISWLTSQVEHTSGTQLDDAGRAELRRLARRLAVSAGPPVGDPVELASAGLT
jgi:EmrB/QacA subfamily drug resistance transporter